MLLVFCLHRQTVFLFGSTGKPNGGSSLIFVCVVVFFVGGLFCFETNPLLDRKSVRFGLVWFSLSDSHTTLGFNHRKQQIKSALPASCDWMHSFAPTMAVSPPPPPPMKANVRPLPL